MGKLLDYRKPPVVEVAIGVQFAPIASLTVPYIGLFWEKIREDFVRAEEQGTLPHIVGPVSTEPQFTMTSTPELPRTWFLSEKGDRIIQIQRDRFHYNWRKLAPEDQYPRYPIVKNAFFDYWTRFCRFLEREKLPPPVIDQCELVYVNHITKGEAWNTAADLPGIFSIFRWAPRHSFLQEPESLRWSMRFPLPGENGWLHFDGFPAKVLPTGPEVIRFPLTARGCPNGNIDDQALAKWFDVARESIVRGFADLTTDQTDTLWERLS